MLYHMINVPTIEKLIQAGVHLGHKTMKRHPKMTPYIFAERHTIHIINMEETQKKLEVALSFLKEAAALKKSIVFVGTKESIRDLVQQYATECAVPFVTERWLGGTITNFPVISKLMKRLKDLRSQRDSGELVKYTKKEQLQFTREIEDLEKRVGGIENMTAIPDILIIIDLLHEKTARKEASFRAIPVVALCDTNINPEGIAYPIPSNDDSRQTVELMLSLFAQAIQEGREETLVVAMPDVPAAVK